MIECRHFHIVNPNALWHGDAGVTITEGYRIKLKCIYQGCGHEETLTEEEYREKCRALGFDQEIKRHGEYVKECRI